MSLPDKLPSVKFPRAAAIEVARELCQVLRPVTERLIVAGSLRRRRAEVGDVEILFIPITGSEPDGFFDTRVVNLADRQLDQLLAGGRLEPRLSKLGSRTWGQENKLAVHKASGIPVDLFTTNALSWYNYLVCRTGSAENNVRIAAAAKAKGWQWHPYGSGFTDELKQARVVQSEREVFEYAGLPYLEPWER
jgi:DNA polymerase/3'-5' exonuclease PolX